LKAVGWQGGSAADFLRTIRDDSGLLTGWGPDHYGFMPLGFQEYLAAREIRRRVFNEPELLRELAAHFGESWWQEVTLLLLALEEPSHFAALMGEVVKKAAFANHPDWVDFCLDDAAETTPEPFAALLEKSPGEQKSLWRRQAAALRVLERPGRGAARCPARAAFPPSLRGHPAAPGGARRNGRNGCGLQPA
jgi:hypothetical protein